MFCQSCGASVAEGNAFCTSCGKPIVRAAAVASPVPPGVLPPPSAVARAGSVYAGFWLRLLAAFLDGIILGIPLAPLALIFFAGMLPAFVEIARSGANPMPFVMSVLPRIIFFSLLVIVSKWLYWGLMESSAWQATLGKKALGLYVTDLAGRRCTFGKTSGRFWAGRGITIVPSLGGLYYLVDCICAGVTEHKQAVHDMTAGCLVMRKP
jgi:uncharacterized RDD family membrane protein YckC